MEKQIITVYKSRFHGGEILYQGKSEAQAIRIARRFDCKTCQCGGPRILTETHELFQWQAKKPFVYDDKRPFWVQLNDI